MKNIKSYIAIVVVIAAVLFNSGCSKDWLDINEDPNNPASASAELVFPAGVVSVASQTGGWYNLLGGFWSQYWSQSNAANQYKFIDQYQINDEDFNRMWREMYAGALKDLQYVIDESESAENWPYFLMATVTQAYAFQFMVDLYDAIPYTEALQGDAETVIFKPAYDSGYDVYMDLLNRIDTALAKDVSGAPSSIAGDYLFGGDMAKWAQFANTLKLKMFLRMAYSHTEDAQAGIAALYASGAEFLSEDAALKIFEDAENKDNPLYAADRRKLNVGTNLRVSTTLFRYFEENSDPRLDLIIEGGTLPMPQGGFNIPSTELDPPSVCVFALGPTDAVYFISEVESYLLQAEAVARGWGTGDAKQLYDMAVMADFARKGLDAPDTTFLAPGGVYEFPAGGSEEDKLEAIIMAKWAAFAGSQCVEAFFETNRTGYPKVSSVAPWVGGTYNSNYVGGMLTYSLEGTTNGLFPKRLIYPQDEVNLNSNYPGQTNVTDKVWWDKK
jgi:hypothetical protein